MNDLISKSNFFISLLHCKKLTLESFEIIAEHLECYPIEVDMNKIKEQIAKSNKYRIKNQTYIKAEDIINILNKGGV